MTVNNRHAIQSFSLGEDRLTYESLFQLASSPSPSVVVSSASWKRLDGFRQKVEAAIDSGKTIYGINTGFGFLSDVRIETEKLEALQLNLIRSHACGVGEPLPKDVVRALLVLRAHTFLLGYSAVRRSTVEKILEFLSHDILPYIPAKGSVGASGDLAPLAHLALGLIGEGDVFYKSQLIPAKEALTKAGIEPLRPAAKEGLSLINGTQVMTVIAAFVLAESKRILEAADIAAALSLDAFRGTDAAFKSSIQKVRPHAGQARVAQNMCALVSTGDEIRQSHKDCDKVQDPYSFRCVPQVHGASRDAFGYAANVVDIELNSVTDNPLVFEDGSVVSGGNFHGQPVALAMDFLGIAMSEIASISERRIEKLTNPAMSRLPAFVIKDGGLNSGFMIPHVVAAALVSENKVLAHPASVDSIPTSADKEDHVSMGTIAARKAWDICRHVSDVLSIEFLTAAQGVELHLPLKPSLPLRGVVEKIRSVSDFMGQDRSLASDIREVSIFVKAGAFSEIVRKHVVDFL